MNMCTRSDRSESRLQTTLLRKLHLPHGKSLANVAVDYWWTWWMLELATDYLPMIRRSNTGTGGTRNSINSPFAHRLEIHPFNPLALHLQHPLLS